MKMWTSTSKRCRNRHKIEGVRLRQILNRSGQLDQIQSDVKTQKTFDFLIDNANVEDVEEVEEED